eukprot:TRINITY_DN2414_c3_g1_i4.p1 TRINITY_DN2414_c3_g1~~TRINITY_DN2414_c3_g1_i4.p1  ORF type:complete len:395 (-),score=72.87 TRINITY_DN2414_c3_g1_i4:41-1225(-)
MDNSTIESTPSREEAPIAEGRVSSCGQFFISPLRNNHSPEVRRSLLHSFYNGLMIEAFPLEDELDPIETWEQHLNLLPIPTHPPHHLPHLPQLPQPVLAVTESQGEVVEVLLFFDAHLDQDKPLTQRTVIGGGVVEYFLESGCGLLAYFVVSPTERNRGLSKVIIQACVDSLYAIARERDPCVAYVPIFAETNDPHCVPAGEDSLAPNIRLGVLHKLGFGLLNCDYVQPPLSKHTKPCTDLLLTVFLDNNVPTYTVTTPLTSTSTTTTTKQKRLFLPAARIYSWIHEFWSLCLGQVCDDGVNVKLPPLRSTSISAALSFALPLPMGKAGGRSVNNNNTQQQQPFQPQLAVQRIAEWLAPFGNLVQQLRTADKIDVLDLRTKQIPISSDPVPARL